MIPRVALAGLALLLLQAAVPQDWRSPFVASFDEAWQVIHDTFPDPDFGGVDWAGVRRELRPRIESAASAADARAVIREMLARLGRSHFGLMSEAPPDRAPGDARVPMDVRLLGNHVIVTGVPSGSETDRAGIRPGDRLVSIDGAGVDGWITGAAGASERARQLEAWRRVDQALTGAPGSVAALGLAGLDGRRRVADVRRIVERGTVVRFGNLPPLRARVETEAVRTPGGRPVGVIRFNVWMAAIDGPLMEAVDRHRGADALVIDLRGNPGGLAEMIRGVAGHVVDEPLLLGRMRMRGADLEFRANPRRATPDGRRVVPFAGPVAILVDELTASASECFAGGLQSLGRAWIVGRPTAGQALPALTRRLPSGDVMVYAVGDFVTSAGQALEGRGVEPDEVVPLDPGRLAADRDPDLAAALGWVDAREGFPPVPLALRPGLLLSSGDLQREALPAGSWSGLTVGRTRQ